MQRRLVIGLVAVGALSGFATINFVRADDPRPSVTAAPATAAAPTPAVDARTQYDLVADIDAAMADEEGDLDFLYDGVRRDYVGKRFHWTAHFIPALCPSPESCNVLAFEHGGRDKHVVQGWTPNLSLEASDHAALESACSERRPCTFAFTGTLREMTLSTDEFTSLRFADVKLDLARLR